MNYSKQRQMILHAVQSNPVHPTAETVFLLLKGQNPNLSLGTVYRNLNLLADHKIILRLSVPSSPDRFDGNTKPHYHFYCNCCGQVSDLTFSYQHYLDRELQNKSCYRVESHSILFSGICPNCAAKE